MQQIDTRLLVEKTRPSTLPKKVVYSLVRLRTSPRIVRWTFLLFVFTIPFEAIDLEALRGVSSLSRVVGLLFFSACFLYPKVCFRRPPQAFWWFAGYASVFGLGGLFIPEDFVDLFIQKFKTIIQLLVLFWIGSTLLQEEKVARHTLLAFSIPTLFLYIGMLLGVPGFSVSFKEDRLTLEGLNADGFGLMMALGSQALLWFGIEQTPRNIWMRVTFIAMSLVPLTAMVRTGTRGAMLAFVAGVALYILPYRGSKRKMVAILGATIAVICIVYTVVNNKNTLSRFENTYNTGDTAGRDRLIAASIEMISEKPLLGWGPIAWLYELGPRVGKQTGDSHNLVVSLLTMLGLLGAIPFIIGLGLCIRGAWTARLGNLGLFPMVWLATMLVDSMTINTFVYKTLWLVLMLSLASGASTVKQYKRKNLMIRTILQHEKRSETVLKL